MIQSRPQSPRSSFVFLPLIVWFTAASTGWTASDTLKNYVERPESVYSWKIIDKTPHEGVLLYDVLLTSQTWTDLVWTHHLSVVVPNESKKTGHALLFITGGGNKDGQPNPPGDRDDELKHIGAIGAKTGSIVAVLRQVPNQPLYGGKVEDDLISYTYDQYLKTGNQDWPLLLPMTKSAVKAMDAIQELAEKEAGEKVEKFVVSGGSKRGWTTWLAGAVDPRVAAIAPMVIDTLNFEKQMPYQLEVWGAYSDQIEDYTKLNLQERMNTPEGKVLNQIVDPYSYLDALTMPKMIFIGTNDPYWPVDAIKHYLDDLKGDNSIHYVPNAGHGLGDGEQAVKTLGSFFAEQASGGEHPPLSWKLVEEDGKAALEGKGDQSALDVVVWTACSGSRDFRKAKWEKSEVEDKDIGWCSIPLVLPEEGYKAFYAEVYYYSPLGGTYSKCSRVFVADKNKIL